MRISDWSSDVCSTDLPSLKRKRTSSSTSISTDGHDNSQSSQKSAGRARGASDGGKRGGNGHASRAKMNNDSATGDKKLAAKSKIKRSEERRGGKESVSTCRSRWSP